MESVAKSEPPKRKSVWKMALFAFFTFLLLSVIAFYFMIWPLLEPIVIVPQWKKDFGEGAKIFYENREEGTRRIEKALSDAQAANGKPVERGRLHRNYAEYLYEVDDWQKAEQQLQIAIDLIKDPQPLSHEADLLTHAYQDRSWEAHKRYLKDKTQPSGVEDQEQSVAIAEKWFGKDHEQTVYKLPSLALIYSDIGQRDKSRQIMDRAIAATKLPSAKECTWFVCAMGSRIKAAERDYNGSLDFFLKGREAATNREQKSRVWEEFKLGLEQGHKEPASPNAQVLAIFKKGQFEQLDRLAEELRRDETPLADGRWALDEFYSELENKDDSYESDYTQRIYEIKKWIAKYPKSPTAKVALAECYTDYAWLARGSGYADSVTDEGWKHFSTRIDDALQALRADPDIRKKDPHSFKCYATVALAQGWDTSKYKELLNDAHHKFPKYYDIDRSALFYFLPRWHGADGDVEKYIAARADSVKGPKGDELYAQLVWTIYRYLDNLFAKDSLISWPRTKAGFHQIFKDFPDNVNARTIYIDFALKANDKDALKDAFVGFK